MSKIHINRGGNSLGTFSEEEVKAGIDEGKFLLTDLAWKEGMPEWKTLGTFPEFSAGADSPVPTPFPGDATDVTTIGDMPPWENRKELGAVKALIESVKAFAVEPQSTFVRLKRDGGLGNPLVYFLIFGVISGIISTAYQLVMSPQMAAQWEAQGIEMPAQSPLMIIGATLFMLPIFLILGIFIWSGILHLCLKMVGAAESTFETTFRVCAYALGTANLAQLVPACGGVISLVWGIVLLVIGFKETHRISTGKAVIAVLIPVLVCCGLSIAAVGSMVGAIAAMAGGGLSQ